MKKQAVIDYFGSASEVAKRLGISKASVSQWPDDIPPLRAYQIQEMTGGKLAVKPKGRENNITNGHG